MCKVYRAGEPLKGRGSPPCKVPPSDDDLRLADEIVNLKRAAEAGNDPACYEELVKRLGQLEDYYMPGGRSI